MKRARETGWSEDKVATVGTLIPIVKDLKELIRSTAKATQTVLKKEISEVRQELRHTQLAIRASKEELRQELRVEFGQGMQSMERRLGAKIDAINFRVNDHETRIVALEKTGS